MSTILCVCVSVRTRVALRRGYSRESSKVFEDTEGARIFIPGTRESGCDPSRRKFTSTARRREIDLFNVGLGLATRERPIPIIPYCSIYSLCHYVRRNVWTMYARSSPSGPNDLLDIDQGVRKGSGGLPRWAPRRGAGAMQPSPAQPQPTDQTRKNRFARAPT
ncbi:hypothetical protein CIHG_09530 [Coccidioides immitis H538.4]|uniref:Uncharacterized protein n=1 Tax=Coccidioides immitis H538.4 TaxID=396776 RepID=A0A0J8UV51_COCIT|nr:hypothetical protein CIHG_09530 [Coccidioides immitis H538.4]